jgi:hypothetical protein
LYFSIKNYVSLKIKYFLENRGEVVAGAVVRVEAHRNGNVEGFGQGN